jgi:hypothetical protein
VPGHSFQTSAARFGHIADGWLLFILGLLPIEWVKIGE